MGTCEKTPLHPMSEPQDDTKKIPSLLSSSRHQLILFASLYASNILTAFCYTLMAPFYPRMAEEKFMPRIVSGWVFGIFALVQFLYAPIAGKLCSIIGARFVLLAGTFFSGGCTILFGFIDKIPASEDDNSVFTAYSFILRIFLGIGCTSSLTASFTITARTFPDNGPSALGVLESATGLGFALGPGISGLVYEFGGFTAPFLLIGLAVIVPLPLYWCLLRGTDDHDDIQDEASMVCLLKVPKIWCILLSVMVSAMTWMCLDPILEPHLRQFGLRPFQVGLFFLTGAVFYTATTPFVGRMTETLNNSTPLMTVGYAVVTVSVLLMGPSALIGLQWYRTLWLTRVSYGLMAVGASLALVPTFGKLLESARKVHSGNIDGAVAGLWTSAYALGDFIAPTYSTAAYEAWGFSWTMTTFGMLTLFMFFFTLFLYIYERRAQSSKASEVI